MAQLEQEPLTIPCFCESWASSQRLNLAALCSYVLNSLSWSNNEKERMFRRAFMLALYQHLGIEDIRERELLDRLSIDGQAEQAIPLLVRSFKAHVDNNNEEHKDIRAEIISDLLLVCLGLSPKNLPEAQKPDAASESRSNLKERLDKVISSVVGSDGAPSALSKSSKPIHMKPGEYDARARAILFKVASHLEFSTAEVSGFETGMGQQLYFIQQREQPEKDGTTGTKLQESANEAVDKHDKLKKRWRWMATGFGVVVGATAIGLTGGLAAPLVAVGLGVITGGFVITGSTLILITGLFGIAGGGLAGYKVRKRTQGLKEFSFTHITPEPDITPIPSLYLNIVISGYLLDSIDEITKPWLPTFQGASEYHDTFALTFDPDILKSLGKSFKQFIAQQAVRVAAVEVIRHTVFGVLASALILPASLIRAGDLIDNPWALGADRAYKAGLVLADVLIDRVQGKRPTVLIGYSLGALLIWHCLQELARRQEYGLVDSVILIGGPIPADPIEKWELASTVVARRIVNTYATNDIVLGVVYRMHSLDLNVAGLKSVNHPKIQNFDFTRMTSGHLGYSETDVITKILQEINLD